MTYKCEDCKDTGKIETETVILSRPYYSLEQRGLVIDTQGQGDWAMTVCPCLSDE
jgi:hypothetical protein